MTATDPMELADELRSACKALRVTPLPMAQVIPLLQRAADMLERLNDPTGVLQASGGKPGACRACGMAPSERTKYANGCPMNVPELSCPNWATWRGEK